MCGIVCAFNIKGDNEFVRSNVLKMAQRVRHRGPDGVVYIPMIMPF